MESPIHYPDMVKRTVHSNNKCGLIERVLDTDSNEPPLASIRELEPPQKKLYKKAHDPHHGTTDDVRIAWLSSR